MDTSLLISLQQTIDARNQAYVGVASENPDERARAAAEVSSLDSRIAELQQAVIEGYSPSLVKCRDIGHVWDVSTETVNDTDVLVRTLKCYRCDSVRTDQVARTGDLNGRSYKHGENYLMPKGQRFGKNYWRGLTFMQASKAQTR